MRWSALFFPLGLWACNGSALPADCSEAGTNRGGVFSIDAQTLEPVCNVATGLYSDRFTSLSPASGIQAPCDGLHEFPPVDVEDRGSVRLEVYAEGYQPSETTIRIDTDACGEQAVSPSGPRDGLPGVEGYITVALQPR